MAGTRLLHAFSIYTSKVLNWVIDKMKRLENIGAKSKNGLEN